MSTGAAHASPTASPPHPPYPPRPPHPPRPRRSPEETTDRVLGLLLRHRRGGRDGLHARTGAHACHAAAREQVGAQVAAGQPVVLTLPAFPCKSPNPAKVLGPLPDLGERLALRFLDGLCREIAALHPAGARIVICSDGHVFGDLVRVPDEDVTAYGDALVEVLREEGLTSLEVFGLADVHPSGTWDERRQRLVADHAVDLEGLRAEVRRDPETLRQYRGITRFLLEDADVPGRAGSRAALLRESRRRAYGVIQRSRAWSSLVAAEHPGAVRLSIHPQPCDSPKLGIALLAARDSWTTPWHSVAVQRPDGEVVLMRRSEAERIGELVVVEAQPSHFRLRDAA